MPLVSGNKMIKILSKKGFVTARQRSRHIQMKDDKRRIITIPVHSGKKNSIGVLIKILRDAEITREEFIKLEKSV